MYGIANDIVQQIDNATEMSHELKQSIAEVLVDEEFHGRELSSFLKKVSEHPELSNDPLIVTAMQECIPTLLHALKAEYFDSYPWAIVQDIEGIPPLIETPEIQEALAVVRKTVMTALSQDWEYEVIPAISNTEFFAVDPEIRILVAYLCYEQGENIQGMTLQSEEWMTASIIRAAVGASLDSVSESMYEREIDEYCSLLTSHDSPWIMIDVLKDIPKLWKDTRIQSSLEEAVPRIAEGIKESRYPLVHLVRHLLVRDSVRSVFAGAPWVFKHDEINKALRESSYVVFEELSNVHHPLHENLKNALWEAGYGDLEPEVPHIAGLYAHHDHDRFYGIVDVKGWEYVSEKIAEQLKMDPSYADILVKQMPTYVDGYFDERDRFQREFGFELVSLLYPYKPEGYVETLTVVYDISWSQKGHDWVWEKYEEELEWVQKEAGLRPEDFM